MIPSVIKKAFENIMSAYSHLEYRYVVYVFSFFDDSTSNRTKLGKVPLKCIKCICWAYGETECHEVWAL
jgi:hypothetical protein